MSPTPEEWYRLGSLVHSQEWRKPILRHTNGLICASSPARLSLHSTPISLLLKCKVNPRDLLRAVEQEISLLEAASGQILYGLHRGPVCDLDNALVCGLRTKVFDGATQEGLRLERGPTPADGDHHYCYGLVSAKSPLRYWRVSRTVVHIKAVLDRGVGDSTDVWQAVKHGTVEASPEWPAYEVSLRLGITLDGPSSVLRRGTASVLKPLIDGTTCALQMDDRATLLRKPAAYIAKRLGQPTSTILGWLADQRTAVLGRPTAPLAAIKRTGEFSWKPCDERYAAVDVRLRQIEGPSPLRLRVAVHELTRIGTRTG